MRRILAGLLVLAAYGQTVSNTQRVANWKEDLNFFAATLKRTPIPGEKNPPGQKDFAKLYPHFDADLEAPEPVRPDIAVMPTIAEFRVGRDPILEAAIAAPR